ncbi:tautomerase family protein [Longirhabdus pacifica]|uniref:tautomerase family protein n=1 Tax=Longirhabdus pacifica TaxID=2305227 RepID=UPI0023EA60BF|nr:4-oxalocrotonate tautomerase family protein [Longirhabdus pacifica]
MSLVPYIHLQITKGASRAQKEKVVQEFTTTLVNVLGKHPEHIHIVIDEVEEENWGFAGMLTDDYRKQN